MITKISSNEYLRRVNNMDVAERDAYLKRVGEWLENQAPLLLVRANDDVARFQNAIQCSAGWNDAECQAWTDGARLLTAMAGKTDTWLPDMLYVKSARRAIRQMVSVVSSFKIQVSGDRDGIAGQQTKQVAKEEPAEETTKATLAVAPFRNSDQGNHDGEGKPSDAKATPIRPKHIDQYVHLLPQKTQEKAATVKGLLRDLDVAREKMRLLMDDPKASDDSRAQWAKTATTLNGKVKAIYKELDAEWEKLVKEGRVVVDDLGNAHVKDDVRSKMEDVHQSSDISPQTSKDAEETAKRIEYLKKWLRDTRTKASDERKKQWEENCRELLSLGGEITDSIRKAGEVYGVNLDDITK